MFDFLKKLSGGSRESGEQAAEPATQYKDYTIVPAPREESGGWTTEATITRVIDGQTRTPPVHPCGPGRQPGRGGGTYAQQVPPDHRPAGRPDLQLTLPAGPA